MFKGSYWYTWPHHSEGGRHSLPSRVRARGQTSAVKQVGVAEEEMEERGWWTNEKSCASECFLRQTEFEKDKWSAQWVARSFNRGSQSRLLFMCAALCVLQLESQIPTFKNYCNVPWTSPPLRGWLWSHLSLLGNTSSLRRPSHKSYGLFEGEWFFSYAVLSLVMLLSNQYRWTLSWKQSSCFY